MLTTLLLVPLALFTSCAKVPEDSGSETPTRYVNVMVRMRGALQTSIVQPGGVRTPYYYFMLIHRTDTYGEAGPVPVVNIPWGNGFAASSQANTQGFVGFVVFSEFGGSSGYEVYAVPKDSAGNLIRPEETGTGLAGFIWAGKPDQFDIPQTGEDTLHFRIDLNQLPNPGARYLKINFLATNNLPTGADPNAAKIWDALGDGSNTGDVGSINTVVTIDVSQGQTITNSDTLTPEPSGDVRDHLGPLVDDASLGIIDWSVEVQAN